MEIEGEEFRTAGKQWVTNTGGLQHIPPHERGTKSDSMAKVKEAIHNRVGSADAIHC